jgi:hypothetical protein
MEEGTNQTQFHVLVPSRVAVWQTLAALLRLDLLDPAGVPMEDITDLLDLVRFCRAHQATVQVPVNPDGRCPNEVLARLFEQVGGICGQASPEELHDDLTAVPDIQMDIAYRQKECLTSDQIARLVPIATSPWRHRWVTRGVVDPDDTGITYLCEVALLDPFDLKVVSPQLRQAVGRHLDSPEAYVSERSLVKALVARRRDGTLPRCSVLTLTFGAGFISQYALATMEHLAHQVPGVAIVGGTPEDAAVPATVPLCENNLWSFRFPGNSGRGQAFLRLLLEGGLLATPGEQTVTSLQLANGGRALPGLKAQLAERSAGRRIIDEAVLQRGHMPVADYLSLVQELSAPGGNRASDPEQVRLATHAIVAIRDIEEAGSSQALIEDAAFRSRTLRESPQHEDELRELFENSELGRQVQLYLGNHPEYGREVCVGVHWRYTGYFPQALTELAAEQGFGLEPDGEGAYLVR